MKKLWNKNKAVETHRAEVHGAYKPPILLHDLLQTDQQAYIGVMVMCPFLE